MFASFARRSNEAEIMDGSDYVAAELIKNLADLQRVNRYLGGTGALTGHLFPISSGRGFFEIKISRSRQTLTAAERAEPSSRQLFESTSPHGPCQRLLWGEGDSSSSPGSPAHQAAVGTTALRSAASTSPVSPARAARPPRTKT